MNKDIFWSVTVPSEILALQISTPFNDFPKLKVQLKYFEKFKSPKLSLKTQILARSDTFLAFFGQFSTFFGLKMKNLTEIN